MVAIIHFRIATADDDNLSAKTECFDDATAKWYMRADCIKMPFVWRRTDLDKAIYSTSFFLVILILFLSFHVEEISFFVHVSLCFVKSF